MTSHRVKRALAALLMAVGALVVVVASSPSPAMASYSDCPAAKLCTFWDINFNSPPNHPHYDYTSPFYTCIEIGEPWDNDISSIVNNRSIPVRFYTSHGCVPGYWDVSLSGNGDSVSQLAPGGANDAMSSFYISWTPPGGLN